MVNIVSHLNSMDYTQWMMHINRELLISKAKLKQPNYEKDINRNGVVDRLPLDDLSLQPTQGAQVPQLDDEEVG